MYRAAKMDSAAQQNAIEEIVAQSKIQLRTQSIQQSRKYNNNFNNNNINGDDEETLTNCAINTRDWNFTSQFSTDIRYVTDDKLSHINALRSPAQVDFKQLVETQRANQEIQHNLNNAAIILAGIVSAAIGQLTDRFLVRHKMHEIGAMGVNAISTNTASSDYSELCQTNEALSKTVEKLDSKWSSEKSHRKSTSTTQKEDSGEAKFCWKHKPFRDKSKQFSLTLRGVLLQIAKQPIICYVPTGQVRMYVRHQVFIQYHAPSHPGTRGTQNLVSDRYVWKSAFPDITHFVRSCPDFQPAKARYNYWICRSGLTSNHTTDRRRNFKSELHQLNVLFGITRHHTTSHNPKANGLVKQLHHTMTTTIMTKIRKSHDLYALPTVLFRTRTTHCEDTGYTAAEIVYVSTRRLPADFFDRNKPSYVNEADFVKDLTQTMNELSPATTNHHDRQPVFIHKDLTTRTHMYIRVKATLEKPCEVLKKHEKDYEVKTTHKIRHLRNLASKLEKKEEVTVVSTTDMYKLSSDMSTVDVHTHINVFGCLNGKIFI